uniref:Cation efflux protein transmembrane domain-containing protein n=1 Tax=Medicago truncatula TaxID=3880 RepID=I3SIX5_MEDTR|nr:unknown [Medicago truncatula]
MIFATVVKLILWLYCRSSRNKIVRAYADDHHFDVVTNVVGLVAAILGDKFYWWIDPIGTILLAIYTISNWSRTVMENAGNSQQKQNFKHIKCYNMHIFLLFQILNNT